MGTVLGSQDQEGCVHTFAVKAPRQLWVGIFSLHHTLELPRELWQEDPGLRSRLQVTALWDYLLCGYFEKHSSIDLPKHIVWNSGQVSLIWFQFAVLSILLGWHQSIMHMETNFMHHKLPTPLRGGHQHRPQQWGNQNIIVASFTQGSTRPCACWRCGWILLTLLL